MQKGWIIKDTNPYFYRLGVRRATQGLPFADEKNPALAYTFSLFFWGSGQGYSGQRMRSLFFQTLMIVLLAMAGAAFLYRKHLPAMFLSFGISYSAAFLSAEFLLFGLLVIWSSIAGDAYHAAEKARRVPFRGVQNRVMPMICSLIIPGWGQFMNGQPVKGSMLAGFSIVGFFSLATIPAVLFSWPALEPSAARAVIETIFAVSVVYAPLIPLIWILSSYDALRVSIDDTKKETLLDRLMLAANRIQSEGWVKSALPLLRSAGSVALLVIALVAVKNHYHITLNHYWGHLETAQAWLQKQGMTIVPDLISKLQAATSIGGR